MRVRLEDLGVLLPTTFMAGVWTLIFGRSLIYYSRRAVATLLLPGLLEALIAVSSSVVSLYASPELGASC